MAVRSSLSSIFSHGHSRPLPLSRYPRTTVSPKTRAVAMAIIHANGFFVAREQGILRSWCHDLRCVLCW